MLPRSPGKDGSWNLPGARHANAIRPALDAGCYFAGVDVGESYGSPAGRKVFTAFHRLLVEKLGLDSKAMLFPVSRGGLMHYNWAAEHPEAVRCIGAIYPVCNLTSYPRLERAAKTYGLTLEELKKDLANHNPIDRLAPLAEKKVPLFHLHGDADKVVPLADNSGLLASRYRRAWRPIQLIVVPGKGHEIVPELWEDPRLAEFFCRHLEEVGDTDSARNGTNGCFAQKVAVTFFREARKVIDNGAGTMGQVRLILLGAVL
jgi:pimeloyl-ACP methyl ester carboxylesterase